MGAQGWLEAWEIESGKQLYKIKQPGSAKGLIFSHDGEQLALVQQKKVSLLKPRTGELVREIDSAETLFMASFSPNGKMLVMAGFASFTLWDVDSGKQLPAWKSKAASVHRRPSRRTANL